MLTELMKCNLAIGVNIVIFESFISNFGYEYVSIQNTFLCKYFNKSHPA